MKTSTRVFYNTMVLYVKIVVSLVINLLLTRVVLDALGIDDFGIYSVIAGVIAILAFVQSALMSSVQRYLSVALGENNNEKTSKYFSASLLIHIFLGLIIILLFELCGLFLFDGFLNIPDSRIPVAKIIYQIMIFSTFFTVIGIPFHATINSYEDIWFYGLTQIICTFLRLGLIYAFVYLEGDKLVIYSIWMAATVILGEIASMIWCFCKYKVCKRISLSVKKLSKYIKDMLSFIGWNTVGAFAIVARNQGVSIVLNIYFGPRINGVFGLANQVDGQLSSFANNLTASLSPQIVKSYGQGNIERLRYLSLFACKLSFFLSAIFAIPLLIELPLILEVWLVEVPPYAELYIKLVLIIFLICELYPGLNRGIQAVGNIKWQQIICALCVISSIPIGIIMFSFECPHYAVVYVMIAAQAISFAVHIYWSNKLYGLKYKKVYHFLFCSVILFILIYLLGSFVDSILINRLSDLIRFLIVISSTAFLFSLSYLYVCFSKSERLSIKNLTLSILHHKKYRTND